MTELPSVDDVTRASQALGLGATAAELHGALCGWLAAGGAPGNDWPARVLADDNLPPVAADSVLGQLLQATIKQLEDRDFAFELLLTDGDDVSAQADAMFSWTRSFLGGFGLGSGGRRPTLSEEGEEALTDMASGQALSQQGWTAAERMPSGCYTTGSHGRARARPGFPFRTSRTMTELPSVDDVTRASQALGLGATAAELHGALCGWLAAGGAPGNDWPARVLADDNLPPVAADSVLGQLLQATIKQLEDRDFAFELLLTDGDDVSAQADAMFSWTRSFLGGFGLGSGGRRPTLSEEGEEALTDMASLARASSEDFEAGGDDDDEALSEIEEFIRVAVLLLHGDVVLASRHRQRLN